MNWTSQTGAGQWKIHLSNPTLLHLFNPTPHYGHNFSGTRSQYPLLAKLASELGFMSLLNVCAGTSVAGSLPGP